MKSKGQEQLLCIPKCLAYHLDGDNDFLVLQDVSFIGFRVASRQNCLSYEQCKYIVEALARFHAISFAFKNEKKQEFDEMASLLTETFFRPDIYENWYKHFQVTLRFYIIKSY